MKDFSIQCKISTNEFHFTQSRYNEVPLGNGTHYIGRLKNGQARLVSETVSLELTEGDVFYIPQGLPYQSYWIAGENGVTFDSFGFSEFPSASGKRFALQKITCNETQLRLIDALATETTQHQNSLKVAGLLLSLLSEVFGSLSNPEREDRQKVLADTALSVMRENFALSIPDVAASCNVSESSLYAAFRKCGYDTPIHEKQKILICKAVQLLISTDDSVEKISADLGFSSSSYFRKIFAKMAKKTPRQVRKEASI